MATHISVRRDIFGGDCPLFIALDVRRQTESGPKEPDIDRIPTPPERHHSVDSD